MRTAAIGLIVAVLLGNVAENAAAEPPQYSNSQQECITTRDVETIVIKLRDEGWSPTRTIGSILDVAQVDDAETNEWFVALVSRVYASTLTLEQAQSEFSQCMQTVPPLARQAFATGL